MRAPDAGNTVRLRWIIAAGLILLTVAVFWPVLNLPFINVDDPEYITQNVHVLNGLNIRSFVWSLGTTHAANWHPVTWFSHMMDVTLFGIGPRGHHAMNLLIHCGNAVLLFMVFSSFTGAIWRSAFLAALFAIHPLRVESVAWVSERKDVLSTFFWVAGILAYGAYVRRPDWRRYGLLLALFVLGLASKPMLVTFPFTLLLIDVWPLKRIHLEGLSLHACWPFVREKLPLFAFSAASSLITFFAQRAGGAMKAMEEISLGARLTNAVTAVVSYVHKTVWPTSLAIFYPFPESPVSNPKVLAMLLALIVATVLTIRVRRSHSFVAVGWLWFLGTLVPVIGLIQVGNQSMADRYTYVPGIGLALIIAWAIPALSARQPIRVGAVACAAAAGICLLSTATVRQIGYWSNELQLFEHALAVTERNWLAEYVIGTKLEQQGQIDAAIAKYRRALEIRPQAPEARNNLGNALIKQGKREEGIAHLREAVRLWPGYVSALSNLGAALCEGDQVEQGLLYLRQAVRQAPDDIPARYNLGLALLSLNRWEEARRHFEEVLRLAPNDVEARMQLERLRVRRTGAKIGSE
jgi:Tfp pilus assembly protein PilF